ncbi:CRISPR system precrRNA processing endoribonuclease RAMP protein Cas6 [Amphibacillus jilinensis]|uniref:CRISPR system precrRNA processing endoribonuclease RAMP protein Cas6 n=1 Tax=Amphibacillus jilinensis TaxID=1216008 RepID=UPI0002E00FCD|nr:CRISPR system precrRNA processing endoribonuclease RAMP protein Cas6 [Amphibacillus jilinensis]
MYNSELFSLSYMPLLIRLKCCESVRLPRYLGSTLHGVMGWILSTNNETYQYIFENRKYGGGKQDIVNPYILEPPRYQEIYNEGDLLCFKFVLLGKATNYTKSVIDSLVSIPYFELGVKRKKFELVDIIQADRLEMILDAHKIYSEPTVSNLLPSWDHTGISSCSIHLITPLRIRRGGKQLKKVDFSTTIRSITRRVTALTERYGGFVDADSVPMVCELSNSVQMTSSGLYWSEISRYSNRRKKKMDLSGLLGAMTFEGNMYHFAPWLYAGRYLHIGRNVTFGCGQLDVVFG